MQLLSLSGVAKSHAGREIFRGIDWALEDRARVGLVGPNGSGKSTLLRILAEVEECDAGQVVRARHARVGYLPQDVELRPGTLLSVSSALPPQLAQVHDELDRIEAQLADPEVYGDESRLARTLRRQESALERYAALGGPQHEGRVRALLASLGFTEADHALDTEALSGGQKKLVALAQLALDAPELLLLDEPDNHLDLAAKQLLESFIRDYAGSVVIVSHDRFLLDETVDAIAQLEDRALTVYKGNYSAYAHELELERLRQRKNYADQQKEIQRIEEQIKRFELWASMVVSPRHMKQARSRRKRLERMEERGEIVEKVRERRTMDLRLDGGRGSRKAVECLGLGISFDGAALFEGLEILVRHGERVGLIGPNGSGKSVLLKMVLGQLEPTAGKIRVGPSTRIGYYAQEHQTLAQWRERTPLELVRDRAPLSEGAAVSFLTKFRFQYEQARVPIRTLSGGERSRLQLACLMLEKPNLLLLDEPTNNLDIPSAEALEGAFEEFDGAILVVSHDRYFLDRTVDRVAVLKDGALLEYPGGYSDYLAARSQ